MRGTAITVLVAVMWWAMAVGCARSHGDGFGLGARRPTPAEQAYIDEVYKEAETVEPTALSRERARRETDAPGLRERASVLGDRPAAVDNSALPWFPPIGDQGYQNSCVAWAAGYYYNTYTQAMDAGIDVSGGDPQHVCSPSFLYPLLNGGLDEGASLGYAMARLGVTGCSSLALKPYDQTDYTSWPSEAAWVEALQWRTTDPYQIPTDSPGRLEAVEQLLANGRLTVVLFDMFANLYYDYPRATLGIDSDVYYCPDGRLMGGHAVTLVGYDDGKAYLDHRDGSIHQGAFLAANSWGASWGVENSTGVDSKGYFWIAYDAFLEGNFGDNVLYTGDRDDYRPLAYALVGISHPARGYLGVDGGAGPPTEPQAVTAPVLRRFGGTELGIDDSERIAIDMTDLAGFMPDCRPANLFIRLRVAPEAASAGIIASAEFLVDLEADGSYEAAPVPNLPLVVAAGYSGEAFLPLFTDVNRDHWAYDDIEACFCAGVVGGYPNGSYQPGSPVTRDQMAVYISRALDGSGSAVPDGPAEPTFSDVPGDHWAYDYVEYAVGRNIVQGYPNGSYGPSGQLDRGQMAAFIARSLANPPGDDGLAGYVPPSVASFPDVGPTFWAHTYIEYIADPERGVAQGYWDGLYHPEYVCTRGQMAAYVARAFGLSG
jgi:hypothetical protein